MSAGAHVQIIREPIGAVSSKLLTSEIQHTTSVECDTRPKSFALDKNVEDKCWSFYIFFTINAGLNVIYS